jgi:hypothetical protein
MTGNPVPGRLYTIARIVSADEYVVELLFQNGNYNGYYEVVIFKWQEPVMFLEWVGIKNHRKPSLPIAAAKCLIGEKVAYLAVSNWRTLCLSRVEFNTLTQQE